jgi:hypothetical protein
LIVKGDWLAIGILIVIAGLGFEAVGVPVMPWIISAFSGWIASLPRPTEHFAAIIGSLAWPTVTLAIAWIFRGPLDHAASLLARRFENDDIDLAGYVKLTRGTQLATLDKASASVDSNSVEAIDAEVVEALLEFAGESHANADKVMDWIFAKFGLTFDPEVFLNAKGLAEMRAEALRELKG